MPAATGAPRLPVRAACRALLQLQRTNPLPLPAHRPAFLPRSRPPSPPARLRLFAYLRTLHDIAAGISYLHSCNVIHGDVKPQNVLLRSSRADARGYVAKAADFG